MHPQLKRQLKRAFGSPESVPEACREFVRDVEEAYGAADKDRALLERSLDLTSQELVKRYEMTQRSLAAATARAKELEDARSALLNALEDTQEIGGRLQRNLATFQALISTMQAGVLVETAERRIFALNRAFMAIFGVPGEPEALIGGDCAAAAEQAKGLVGDSDHFPKRIADIIAARVPVSAEEVRFRDGRVFERDYSPVHDAQGTFIGHLWQYRDVTDRKRAEERIQELNALRLKFINIVSHQLRTPLNVIRWNLESLLGRELGEMTLAQYEFVRITYEADLEIIRRIHDLLTAMDIEEGRVVLVREPNSLEALWRAVMAEWKRPCDLKKLVCVSEPLPAPLPEMSFDAEKIRQVLIKLIENAVSYTPEGGKIVARLMPKEDRVRFELTDTGVGIPQAEQGRIFTRFHRASNAALMKPDASGLGLSIAKYFVEQHGGTIGFRSQEGRGSTFWFELPIVR